MKNNFLNISVKLIYFLSRFLLDTMILNLVNENLPEITRVGIPATREQWAPILVEHINNFFAQVPLEKFLIP